MCGIAGAINLPEIVKAKELLKHRGPDSFGIYEENNVCLIHRRLAILDLTLAGHQPMLFEDLVIVYNGEIYNFLEIKNDLINHGYIFDSLTDTEVVLKAYHCWGRECVSKFNGMFAFCIYNKAKNSFFIARDKIGIKPLYYYHVDDVFAFGSELKVFPKNILKWNEKSLIQFLVLSYIPAPSSVYDSVFKLEPGCFLEFEKERLSITRYWSSLDTSTHNKYEISDYNQALNLVEGELKKSVKMQMVADVNIGCFLSGGVDSSLMAALAQQNSVQPIETYSMGFPEKEYDESGYAKDVADHLKTNHHTLHFTPHDLLELIDDYDFYFDEPFGDSASLPLSILCKKAKEQGITVALSGDGGDELFLGYDRYTFATKYFDMFKNKSKFLRTVISTGFSLSKNDKALKMIYPVKNPSLLNFYQLMYTCIKPWDLNEALMPGVLEKNFNTEEVSVFDILNLNKDISISNEKDLSNLDILRNLPDDMLTKSDRASMRFSLELRVPLLDSNVVEISRAISNDLLLKDGVKKSILKDILNKYVPKTLIDRPKKGFTVPLMEWFRGELKGEILALKDGLPEFINKRYVEKLVNEHINQGRNHSYTLWNLLRLKKFITKEE